MKDMKDKQALGNITYFGKVTIELSYSRRETWSHS